MKFSQIKSPDSLIWKKGKWFIIGAAVLLIIGGIVYYFFLRSNIHVPETKASQYYTATVKRGDLRVSISGSGSLTSERLADLSFPIEGAVEKLNVSVGENVTEGTILAKLGSIESLEAEVSSLELEVLQAQKELDTLQNNASVALAEAYQTYVTAQETYAAALYAAQKTEYAGCSLEVNTQNAGKLSDATDKLKKAAESGYGSDEWIAAKANYDTAFADYNYCIGYTESEKTIAKADLSVAEVALKQAEDKYNLLKEQSGLDPTEYAIAEATLKNAQARLALAQEELADTTMIAPFDGMIITITAGEGERPGTSTYITIADLNQPSLNIEVDESDLMDMMIGDKAEITFDALPDDLFTGVVTQIEPQLSTEGQYQVIKGVVRMDKIPEDSDIKLYLGMNATVEIIHKEVTDVLLVPIEALRDLGNGEYGVFVQDANGKLYFRTVTVGVTTTSTAEIKSGLEEGEIVSTGITEVD